MRFGRPPPKVVVTEYNGVLQNETPEPQSTIVHHTTYTNNTSL
jgi:hypothetical protein